jgi:NTE family protein
MLEDFALMDFHRAPEAIREGRRLVEENAASIRAWAGIAAARLPNTGAAPDSVDTPVAAKPRAAQAR